MNTDSDKGINWIEFIPKNQREEEIKNKLLTAERIGESLVQKFLSTLLERKGLWVKSPVNLWKLIGRYKTPLDVLNRYNHPLQPDIDILCARFKNNPKTPLFGFEVKLFSRFKQIVIPKTAENKGYYTGIEQTLSLLTYGLDYATLWHVFLVPLEKWEEREDVDQIISENVEWAACYAQFIEHFIKDLHLPIGYKATALSIRRNQGKIKYLDFYEVSAPPQCIFASTPARIRVLLTEKLKIEETIYQKQFLDELIRMHSENRISKQHSL